MSFERRPFARKLAVVSFTLVLLLSQHATGVAASTSAGAARGPATPRGSAQTDDEITFRDLVSDAQKSDPVFGPDGGTFVLDPSDPNYDYSRIATVRVSDSVASVKFENPMETRPENWEIGVAARVGREPHVVLVIHGDGTLRWADASMDTQTQGKIDSFDSSPGASNSILLAVKGDRAFLSVNDRFAGAFDASGSEQSGYGSIYTWNADPGSTMVYEDFSVWSLGDEAAEFSPVDLAARDVAADADFLVRATSEAEARKADFAAQPGVLDGGGGSLHCAKADDAGDFLVSAEFNPPRNREVTWDAGFLVRAGPETDLRVITESTGHWYLLIGLSDPLQIGSIDSSLWKPDDPLKMELLAIGDLGFLSINDQFISTLDLSLNTETGATRACAGFFWSNQGNEDSTSYTTFKLWSLDDEPLSIDPPIEAGSGKSSVTVSDDSSSKDDD